MQVLKIEASFTIQLHAWERPGNEDANGLLRQYLPKKTCLRSLTEHP